MKSETWSVVNAGPRWDSATRSWGYGHRLVPGGSNLSKIEADALLAQLGPGHSASPDSQGDPR